MPHPCPTMTEAVWLGSYTARSERVRRQGLEPRTRGLRVRTGVCFVADGWPYWQVGGTMETLRDVARSRATATPSATAASHARRCGMAGVSTEREQIERSKYVAEVLALAPHPARASTPASTPKRKLTSGLAASTRPARTRRTRQFGGVATPRQAARASAARVTLGVQGSSARLGRSPELLNSRALDGTHLAIERASDRSEVP
jgi:hypothetical protein